MDRKQMIKEFYENVVSNNLISEVEKYISSDCTAKKR